MRSPLLNPPALSLSEESDWLAAACRHGSSSAARPASRRAGWVPLAGLLILGGMPWAGAQVGSEPAPATREQETAWLARLGSRHVRAHDPSTVVKCKDEYWVFYTGWGVPCYHSRNLVDWESGPRVFTYELPWVAAAVPTNPKLEFWAPDIIRSKDRYLLYFSASRFGTNTSAIGLATNPTLDPSDPNYHWADRGVVVQSGGTNDFNTIDPSVFQDDDGSLWLAFGSYWSGIKLIQLDPATGKRKAPDSPMYSLARNGSIEAACLWRRGEHYYLFVNWGTCCRGVNSTYNIRVGRAGKVTGPYLDAGGQEMLREGGTSLLHSQDAFVGPGHAGIVSAGGTNWLSCHFYDGTRYGIPTLALLPLRWNTNGWPEVVLPEP